MLSRLIKRMCTISACYIIYAILIDVIMKRRTRSTLKTHKANIHEIDVVYTSVKRCNYEGKQRSTLKRHKADVQEIDAVYYPLTSMNSVIFNEAC